MSAGTAAEAPGVDRRRVVGGAILAGITGGFFAFWGLGATALVPWDEGLYAKIALEMARTGEWWIYVSDGRQSPTTYKPPLLIYAQILAFRTLGPTELAARLPAAASFVLLVVATTAFCARVLDLRAAVLPIVLLATSRRLLFEHFARHGAADAPLALFLALTIFCLWHARPGRLPIRAGAAYAAALLVKGGAALQVLPVVVLWQASRRAWRDLARATLALGLAALPTVAWLVMRERHAPGFLQRMIDLDVLGRVQRTIGAAPYDPFLYVEMLAGDFLGIALVLCVLAMAVRALPALSSVMAEPTRRDELVTLLAAWTLVPLALFSVARTQHPWYALPSYVPASILAAWCGSALIGRMARSIAEPRLRAAAVAVVLLAIVTIVGGKATSRLRRLAEPDPYTTEMRTFVDALERERRPLVVFPAWEAPALRFYLSRNEIEYHVSDGTDALLRLTTTEPMVVLTTSHHRRELHRALGDRARVLREGPAVRLVAFETAPQPDIW